MMNLALLEADLIRRGLDPDFVMRKDTIPGDLPPNVSRTEFLALQMRYGYQRAVAVIRARIELASLERELRATSQSASAMRTALDAARVGELGQAFRETAENNIRASFLRGAREGERGLRQVEIRIRFDAMNPHAATFARTQSSQLITQIDESQREAVRNLIETSVSNGRTVQDIARDIRHVVGLRDDQVTALSNYRERITERGKFTIDQIESKVRRYADALLRQRGELIARTEVLQAANQGQLETWMEAQRQGTLGNDWRKKWVLTPDELLCLPAKTPVMTMDGWKPISRIEVGEYVLTHEDRFMKVTATRSRHHNGKMAEVHIGGRAGITVKATFGHRIMTARGWIPIEQVVASDRIQVLAQPCPSCGKLVKSGPRGTVRCQSCMKNILTNLNDIRWSDPSQHEKVSEQNRKRWANPKMRERLIAKLSGKIRTNETRLRAKASAFARFQRPDEQKKIREQNKRTAQLSTHPFKQLTPQDREVNLAKAMKARGAKSRGDSYLERKVRWFLETQGIVFEQQWPFKYPDESGRIRQGFADFFIPGPQLVIECDGPMHAFSSIRDSTKDETHRKNGFTPLRFNEKQIRYCFSEVASAIRERCCFLSLHPKRIRHYDIKHQPVYDLTVERDHSFVAGGIVVHNCDSCESMEDAVAEFDEEFENDQGETAMVPPLHPNCRCSIVLVKAGG